MAFFKLNFSDQAINKLPMLTFGMHVPCVHLLLAEPLYYNTNAENLIYGQTYIWHLLNQTPNNTPSIPPTPKKNIY